MKKTAFTIFLLFLIASGLLFSACEKEENNTLVTLIENQQLETGLHSIEWDQTDESNQQVNYGTYKAVLDVNLSSDKEVIFEIMPVEKNLHLKNASDDPDGNDDNPVLYSISSDKEIYEGGEPVILTFNIVNPQEVSVFIKKGE